MRPVNLIGGARRRCAACLLPLAVVVVPPAVVPPVTVVVPPVAYVPPVALLPLAKGEDVRRAARVSDRKRRRGERRDGRRRGGSNCMIINNMAT